jgi:hypothetical protein
MSGYRIPRRTARIVLEGDYEGAEAVARLDVDMGFFFDVQEMLNSGDTARVKEAFQKFGDDALMEWNLEDDDGAALPATGEGMMRIPTFLALAMMKRWSESVGQIPGPLVVPSLNGRASPVESAQTGAS